MGSVFKCVRTPAGDVDIDHTVVVDTDVFPEISATVSISLGLLVFRSLEACSPSIIFPLAFLAVS